MTKANQKTEKVQPGVIKQATRFYITKEDVSVLLGCGSTKALEVVRKVNEYAKKKGGFALQPGKANKYLFAEMFLVPIEDVDRIINSSGR